MALKVTADSRLRFDAHAGAVVEVRWSRPEAANAFDEALVEELLASLVNLRENGGARVLVLGGDGGRFSGGFDLRGDLDDCTLAWRFTRAEQLLAALRDFPAVTVASVAGPAFGLGADIVASCDYRLGDERAKFRFPGPRFGVLLGSRQLRQRVGSACAMDVLLRDRVLDAQSALQVGLLTHLRDEGAHQPFVETLAEDIGGLDARTLRSLLTLLREDEADPSMAALARSAHEPGLADRIERFRGGSPIRGSRSRRMPGAPGER